MLPLYRIQPIITNKRSKWVSNTTLDNNSHRKHGLKMTSKNPKVTSKDDDEAISNKNQKII